MSQGYGEGRADVAAAMKKATRTKTPSRRQRPVPEARPEKVFRARPAAPQAPADPAPRHRKTSVGDSPVVPLFLIGAGMYLAWFGVHYWRSDVKYPTDPIKAVLQGKGLPSATKTPTADEAAVLAAAKQQSQGQALSSTLGTTPPPGIAAAGGSGSASANVNTGKLLAAGYGWGPGSKDWPYLYSGWQAESSWSVTAAYDHADPYNHAYGIPQANPGTKMAQAGPDWKTDAATQIRWGLAYIKNTYGAPSKVPGWTPNGPSAGYQGY
jgi:hypothetical protein